jgi:5'-3' exonuclease
MSRMARNVLIDGNNLIHRAFHVHVARKDPPLLSPTGYPTGLIYGVFSMLSDWLPDIPNATRLCMFLDGKSKHRLALDPGYKMKEEGNGVKYHSVPCTLASGYEARHDLDVINHVAGLFGIDVFHSPDHEADDLIASFIRSRPSDIHVVLSSDKDFIQLMTSDRVVMYRPGVDHRFLDSESAGRYLARLYKLDLPLPPSSVRMFKSLTGDQSDGIRGVFRLRKKLAASVSMSCPSIDGMQSFLSGQLPGFSKTERIRTLESADRIRLNYELIGLRDDLDVSSMVVPHPGPDFTMAERVLSDLGIRSYDPNSFRTSSGPRSSSPVSASPIPSWLQEI